MKQTAALFLGLCWGTFDCYSTFLYVNFDTSMATLPSNLVAGQLSKPIYGLSSNFSALIAERELITQRYKLFKSIFEKNGQQATTNDSQNYLIPKIMHQIWFGPKPLPKHFRFCINSCKKRHPNWEYRLWTEKEVAAENFKYQAFYLDAKRNPAKRSDVLRYEILAKYGGVYLDTDFYCCKSLDDLHRQFDCYGGILNEKLEVGNGMIGTAPQHPLIQYCLQQLQIERKDAPLEIMHNTGPFFFTRCVFNYLSHHPKNQVILLPCSYFHPMRSTHGNSFWNEQKTFAFARGYEQPETLAIHLFACSWQPNSDGTLGKTSQLATLLIHHDLRFTASSELDQLINARRTSDAATPVIVAAQKNLVPVVDLLGRHGADFLAQDKFGRTAHDYAEQLYGAESEIAKLIRAYLI